MYTLLVKIVPKRIKKKLYIAQFIETNSPAFFVIYLVEYLSLNLICLHCIYLHHQSVTAEQ